MNRTHWYRATFIALLAAGTAITAGCVATGGGYGYDDNVGVGVGIDYYEPIGGYYGGWGGGYRVGPYHDRHDRDVHGGGGRPAPHYRPAAAGRSTPSIPSRGGGGGHGHGH